MKKIPYLLVGVLVIGAVITVFSARNAVPPPPSNPLTPTSEIQLITAAPTQVLGEEAIQQTPVAKEASIETNKGAIRIILFSDAAPGTVNNFAQKAQSGFYESLTFHRVEDWVVQGGDPLGNGSGGGQMPTELNNNPFIRGSVGVARRDNIAISNDSQFFITKSDASWLDGQYTNFGQVTEGMEVVDSLEVGDKILSITVK